MSDVRHPRSDAVRNRERVLAAATRVFSEVGPDAGFSEIAREAGAGVGTVYRHFPTRTALVEAAYESEVSALIDAVPGLLQKLSPQDALRAWMDLFGSYPGVKATLSASVQSASTLAPVFAGSRDRLLVAIDAILAARADAEPRLTAEEVLLTVGGIVLTTDSPGLSAQRERIFDVLASMVWLPRSPVG